MSAALKLDFNLQENHEVRDIIRLPKTLEQLDSAVAKRYYSFKQDHNLCQKLGTKAHLKSAHKNLFEVIMWKYLPMFRALVNSPIYAETDEAPSLKTCRKELSVLLHGGKRNIYNILARLAEANVISVELDEDNRYIITPNLFFVLGLPQYQPEINIFQNPITMIPERRVWQKLPHINNQIVNNNKEKAEDLTYPHQGKHQSINQGIAQAENPLEQIQLSEAEYTTEFVGGGEFEGVDNIQSDAEAREGRLEAKRIKVFGGFTKTYAPKITIVPQKGIQPEEKTKIVDDFWRYSKKYLFTNWEFDGNQTKEIKEIIRSDVFGSFNGSDDYNAWRVFLMMRQAELDLMVANNLKYNRTAFYPTAYFSKTYIKRGGFLSAHKWTMKERKKFTEIQHQELLEKAKVSLTCGKIPRGMTERITNPKELVDYWYHRLAKATNDTQIIADFTRFITNISLTRAWA